MVAKREDLRLAQRSLLNSAPIQTTLAPFSSIQTTLEGGPDFTESIGNHTVALGRDAQLSCKIRNLGNFRTAWLRVEDKGILTIHNNIITRNYRIGLTNNDDGKNFVLTIKNVQPSDKGGYMCQINSVPMKYAIGYLDVLTPPAFDDQPTFGQDQVNSEDKNQATSVITIVEGGNATLSCKATGHPNPLITWRREDNEPILLNGATSEGVTKSEGSSISLNSVTRLSSGAYLCIASNNVQPSASKRQVLDVQFSPVIRLPQTEVGAQLGQASARLTCYIELNPLGSYHWVKLNNNKDHQQLSLGSRQQQDQLPTSKATNNNEEDDLWLIEHDELTNSDKFEIVIKQVTSEKIQMTLAIRQVERQDFGWYKCIARNSLGIQSNSIRLYESSSFSLNNMFRASSSDSNSDQSDSDSNSKINNQHQNDQQQQQDISRPNKPILSRTHTRSSWVQRSSSGRQEPNALLDSSSSQVGSSAKSPFQVLTSTCHHHSIIVLLLSLLLSIYLF